MKETTFTIVRVPEVRPRGVRQEVVAEGRPFEDRALRESRDAVHVRGTHLQDAVPVQRRRAARRHVHKVHHHSVAFAHLSHKKKKKTNSRNAPRRKRRKIN